MIELAAITQNTQKWNWFSFYLKIIIREAGIVINVDKTKAYGQIGLCSFVN
jgi:hypothetical protein